ncbi:MAG: ribosomal-protein-alanine N-acetyltransferase [Actinomyces sp.]|nr:MAG: ribosomal-protein-alanine N-acetyltransferase [Actinomyces sp.]
MRGRHLSAVRAIDEVCFSRPWSTALWRRELADPTRVHLVAVTDTVVGHAGLLSVLDEGHVTTVAVRPDLQGRGVASRLLLALFAAARSREIAHLTLEVRAADRRAQRLYGRFGFAPAGVRAAYYSDPTDDAVVMWCHDIDRPEIAERLELIRRGLAPITAHPDDAGAGDDDEVVR